MIRTLIIEDEGSAQKLLTTILKQYCPEVNIVGYGNDVRGSIQMIDKEKPELIFMDIELIDGNSFDILEKIIYKSFHLIFTTAYDEYALKAFKYEAVDYIVKPYFAKDVRKAVDRIIKKPKFEAIQQLFENNNFSNIPRICISTDDSIEFIELAKIIRIEADRSYCTIHIKDGKKLTISKPLKDMEHELPSNSFFRTHQSHIVNCNFIKRFMKEDGGLILLNNGDSIPLARRRKQAFLEMMS